MEKDKKKTLTISSNLKKKIDTSLIASHGKKSFAVDKKKSFRHNKTFNKSPQAPNISIDSKKKILQGSLLNNRQLKILLRKIINQQEKVS